MPTTVREATTAQVTDGARDRIRVTLATPGWGSSGYYAPAVLESAATDRVFPAGTACHVDHPRRSDETELPERSVETMAAVLTEDAHWDADSGELIAEARLFPHKAWLADMADSIGMSIVADADISEAEVEGRTGRVIERIVQGRSVDFVTKAGRGGRFTLTESARPEHVDRRAVRSGVTESTAEQTREALSVAIRAAHGGEDVWSYVEDFDASTVWFTVSGPDSSDTWQQSYTLSGATAALTGDPTAVRRQTTYVPVSESGQPITIDPERGTMPTISESEHARLTEAAGRVTALEAERDQAAQRAVAAEAERDTTAAELAGLRRTEQARPIVESAVAESQLLAQPTRDRLIREALRDLPADDKGALDEAKLRDAVKTAREAAEAEAAAYVTEAGQPRGLGDTTIRESDDAVPDEYAALFGTPQKG